MLIAALERSLMTQRVDDYSGRPVPRHVERSNRRVAARAVVRRQHARRKDRSGDGNRKDRSAEGNARSEAHRLSRTETVDDVLRLCVQGRESQPLRCVISERR
jgi:hypothetical protein